MTKEPKEYKPKVNRKGFITNHNTQDMSKGHPKTRAITYTTEDAPSGEQAMPDLH